MPSPQGDAGVLGAGGQQAVIPSPLSALRVTGACQQQRGRVVESADLLVRGRLLRCTEQLGLIAEARY